MLSQVELNLLTGETTILQTDIIYDCGQSLNPAVDLGQVCLILILCANLIYTHTHTQIP
jgi:xanthine dehydrogenase molybdopterin-binding subunit B